MTHRWQGSLDAQLECRLLERMAANDRLALCLLYEAYLPRLMGLFRHMTAGSDSGLIGQLTEETMMGVWLRRECFAPTTSAYVWIMSAAVTHARRSFGTKARPRATRLEHAPMLAMLAQLSIEERALMHFVYNGHSREEVALLLGASEEGVDALLLSARARIRRSFTQQRTIIESAKAARTL